MEINSFFFWNVVGFPVGLLIAIIDVFAKPKQHKACETCGQQRPYPVEPGKWEYKSLHQKQWTPVRVQSMFVESEDKNFLHVIAVGETEPMWWPNNVMWRKRE